MCSECKWFPRLLSNHRDTYWTSHRKPKTWYLQLTFWLPKKPCLLVPTMSWFSYVGNAQVSIHLPPAILEFLLGNLCISQSSFTLAVSQCRALFWHCAVKKGTNSCAYGDERKELREKGTPAPHPDSQNTGHCQISKQEWHGATSPTLKFNTHLLSFPFCKYPVEENWLQQGFYQMQTVMNWWLTSKSKGERWQCVYAGLQREVRNT